MENSYHGNTCLISQLSTSLVDHSGRYTSLIAFILASSAALCGELMGYFIESQGLVSAILIAAAAVIVSMVLTVVTLKINSPACVGENIKISIN